MRKYILGYMQGYASVSCKYTYLCRTLEISPGRQATGDGTSSQEDGISLSSFTRAWTAERGNK